MDVLTTGFAFLLGLALGYAIGYISWGRKERLDETIALQSIAKEIGELKGIIQKIEDVMSAKTDQVRESVHQSIKFFENLDRELKALRSMLDRPELKGKMGEEFLAEILKESLYSGRVERNVNIGAGVVEFGWKVRKGKYIPIDSKFIVAKEEDPSKWEREVRRKLKERIKEVKKYLNSPNTTRWAILAVPDHVIDAAPDLVAEAKGEGIIIAPYWGVPLVAFLIEEHEKLLEEEGEIGKYKRIIGDINIIMVGILKVIDRMDRDISSLTNKKKELRDHINKALRVLEEKDQGRPFE